MTKGKCYSKNNRGQRNASDFYQTPLSMTQHLLNNEYFSIGNAVFEPCAGEGAIIKVLVKNHYPVMHSDITIGTDFLDYNNAVWPYIITNPPYGLAKEFILKSMEVAENKFAMLLPLSYLHGKERYDIFYSKPTYYPLKRVWVFTRCPMLTDSIREDGKYETGMQIYAWFIWEKTTELIFPQPEIQWIDNSADVLRKGKKNGND